MRAMAAISLALASCSTEGADDGPVFVANPDAGALPAEIGAGSVDFVAVVDGDPVDVVAGPQGGFHVWTSIRVDDLSVETAQVALSARFADGGALAGKPSRVVVTLIKKADRRERAGMTNFINDPAAVRGERIVLRAEVITPDGRAAIKECTVVPR